MSFNIKATIEAVDKASDVFEKVGSSTDHLGGALNRLGGIADIAGGFIVANLATKALGAVTDFVQGSIAAFQQEESALNNLRVAVGNLGEDWNAVKDRMIAKATEFQGKTVYADEQVIAAMQILASFGMKTADIMSAIGTVADLAAAKNLDLSTAAEAVGKAFSGHPDILGRYGLAVKNAESDTFSFSETMAHLNERFSGAAQAQVETSAGRFAQFQNRIGELQERLGAAFIPVMDKLMVLFDKISPVLEKYVIPAIAFLLEVLGASIEGWGIIIERAIPFFEELGARVAAFMEAWNNAWKAIGEGILWIYNTYIKPIFDAIKAGVDAIQGAFSWLSHTLVGHSVWTDMWSAMEDVAERSLKNIQRELNISFEGGLTGPINVSQVFYGSQFANIPTRNLASSIVSEIASKTRLRTKVIPA